LARAWPKKTDTFIASTRGTTKPCPGQQDTFKTFKQNTAALNGGVLTPIRKRSDQLTTAELKTPLQLAFLDGDHSYDATRKTSTWSSRGLRPKGLSRFTIADTSRGLARHWRSIEQGAMGHRELCRI
jgi:hypothetical protein